MCLVDDDGAPRYLSEDVRVAYELVVGCHKGCKADGPVVVVKPFVTAPEVACVAARVVVDARRKARPRA